MQVRVKDAELYCSKRGEGLACLVLSGMGTRPYELMTAGPLSDRLTLVYVDLRGSGLSTGEPADMTFDQLEADLDAVRVHLGVERVAVLGHSILGMLAIEYARRRPDSVAHLILAGTPPRGDMGWLASKAAAFFQENASEDRKSVLRANMAALPAGAPVMQVLLAQTPLRFFDARFDAAPLFAERVGDPRLLTHVMGTLAPAWDVTVGSTALRVPILIAHGRHDYTVPWVLWDGVAERLPNASFEVFERSGHHPFFEEPERFSAALMTWMGRTKGGLRGHV
jgi:proline iminopeptidase